MTIVERFLHYLSHPIESLYRHFLYRRSIPIASSKKLAQLATMWEKPDPRHALTDEERRLLISIRRQTEQFNRDNVTRTEAYLSFFQRCPEVHWAFLAHLVSRNGGWNMTDLKGGLIPSIIGQERIEPIFLFLERANALIFHDAYPQLLLYEESKKRNTKLFHLLPFFAVSSFMRPFWEQFYDERDAPLLTVALIMNEQHYIQKRVVEHPFYRERVVATFPFLCQQWLGLNDVLIPYDRRSRIRLAGVTVHDFADVHHRIQIGKALYGMLLARTSLFRGAYRFASQTAHTGSRADFWPRVFSAKNSEASASIYSPPLYDAWPAVVHSFTDESDWFCDLSILSHLEQLPILLRSDVTVRYENHLQQLRALAKVAH